ncbi:MAG: methyltransferase domain-containing protein [Eggerthellaceae bacterium]|nr:methyltransferase domain-containing protein [Eggerthellaceae bacterium]
MPDNFTPLLSTTDWNEEWRELQKARRAADDASYWDKRSATFGTKDSPSSYADSFLALAGIKPGESVLDMGCGTGSLSIPLGLEGRPVIAADFSPGMLSVLQGKLDELGLENVTTKLMSWEDDWPAHGLGEACVDVALASRSIATSDLQSSLVRLDRAAKRRVCLTITTGSSPRIDARVLQEIGLANVAGYDFQYTFNILVNLGVKPEVSYIASNREESYDSFDEAFEDYTRMVYDATKNISDESRAQALVKLKAWLEAHVVDNPQAGKPAPGGAPHKRLCLDVPRVTNWAFIAWNK